MKTDLKPLDQQVIVITGASSGIGLATARIAAAQQGAKAGARCAQRTDARGTGRAASGPPAAMSSRSPADVGDRSAGRTDRRRRDRPLRPDRHVGQQRRRFDLRPTRRSCRRGQPPAVRHQLLGRRLRLARGAATPQEAGRSADQRRQRSLRGDRAAAGMYSASQARGQGLHRCAADGARRGRRGAGVGHAHPADRGGHAVSRARRATTWTRSRSCRRR